MNDGTVSDNIPPRHKAVRDECAKSRALGKDPPLPPRGSSGFPAFGSRPRAADQPEPISQSGQGRPPLHAAAVAQPTQATQNGVTASHSAGYGNSNQVPTPPSNDAPRTPATGTLGATDANDRARVVVSGPNYSRPHAIVENHAESERASRARVIVTTPSYARSNPGGSAYRSQSTANGTQVYCQTTPQSHTRPPPPPSRLPAVSTLVRNTQLPVPNGSRYGSPVSPQLPPHTSPLRHCYVSPHSSTRRELSSTPPSRAPAIRTVGIPPVTATRSLPSIQKALIPPSNERPRSEQTFSGLVQHVLHHPLLPLVFKGTYETATNTAPSIADRRTEEAIRRALAETDRIEALSRRDGLMAVMGDVQGMDLFFTVLVAAFRALQGPLQPPIPSPLHSMISVCAKLPETNVGSPIESTSEPSPPLKGKNPNAGRPKISEEARQILDDWFQKNFENPYPTDAQKRELARKCGLQLNQVCCTSRFSVQSLTHSSRRSIITSVTGACA